jgi:hypothetical protein
MISASDGESGVCKFTASVNGIVRQMNPSLQNGIILGQGLSEICVTALDRAGNAALPWIGKIRVNSEQPWIRILTPLSWKFVAGKVAFEVESLNDARITVSLISSKSEVEVKRGQGRVWGEITVPDRGFSSGILILKVMAVSFSGVSAEKMIPLVNLTSLMDQGQ